MKTYRITGRKSAKSPFGCGDLFPAGEWESMGKMVFFFGDYTGRYPKQALDKLAKEEFMYDSFEALCKRHGMTPKEGREQLILEEV